MKVSSSNKQDKDYLHIEFLWNSSLLDNNKQESDNEGVNEIQTEENIKGEDKASKSHGRYGYSYGYNYSHDHDHNHGHNNSNNNQNTIKLLLPSFFNTLQYEKPLYEFKINLLSEFQFQSLLPYLVFCLFFSFKQLKIIVKNINVYAYSKMQEGEYKWKDLTIREFRIWLAILIYASIFKLLSIKDYWNRDNKLPEHNITTFITLLHFEQVWLI